MIPAVPIAIAIIERLDTEPKPAPVERNWHLYVLLPVVVVSSMAVAMPLTLAWFIVSGPEIIVESRTHW